MVDSELVFTLVCTRCVQEDLPYAMSGMYPAVNILRAVIGVPLRRARSQYVHVRLEIWEGCFGLSL